MRKTSAAILSLVLSSLLPTAYGQFGGGFAPPQPPSPPPTETPAVPVVPTVPAQTAPADPTEEEVRKYEEENPDAVQKPAVPKAAEPKPAAPVDPKIEQAKRIECKAPEKSWVARMDPADQKALEEGLGYALPPMTSKVKWVGSTATKSAPNLEGNVVIIQSIDVGNTAPAIIDRILATLGTMPADETVIVIGVQVPNKLDLAKKRLEKSVTKGNICIDEDGQWCDALGIYKKPVNLVVDRNGAIRYVGLNEKGVAAAAKLLLAEPKKIVEVAQKPAATAATPAMAKDAVFPTFTEPLNNCADLRGKSSPPLTVRTWLTQEPNMKGKLVIVDFFATSCGPCMAARPHMNEIAKQYASTIAVVGLSDESKSNFEEGLKKKNLKENDFNYALALDPSGAMKQGFGVRGIPSIAIISSDGIVRWQGHPNSLDAAVLDPLVAANAKLFENNEKTDGKSGSSGRGWSK